MKHLNNFEKHNEGLRSWLTGGDDIAKEVLQTLDKVEPEDIKKEVDQISISYSWTITSKTILYGIHNIEIVKFTNTIVLLVDDKEVKSAKWLREKVWKKVEELLGE